MKLDEAMKPMPEGYYAHAKNEINEGALLEIKEIVDDYFSKSAWGELKVIFKDGAVCSVIQTVTKKIN